MNGSLPDGNPPEAQVPTDPSRDGDLLRSSKGDHLHSRDGNLIVSLHDVAPVHRERIERAEAVFAAAGLRKVTYLLVPDFHGQGRSDAAPGFPDFCRRPRPFAVDWFLHGYYHLETLPPGAEKKSGAATETGRRLEGLKRAFLTAGEGEFLAMGAEEARRRVRAGRGVFTACLGREPEGFVAPAWLFNSALPPVLAKLGFRHTEDHGRLYAVETGESKACPVITWATRTPLRKYGSLLVCPALALFLRNRNPLRLAFHPHDFDHEETVTNIKLVLRMLLPRRRQIFTAEAWA